MTDFVDIFVEEFESGEVLLTIPQARFAYMTFREIFHKLFENFPNLVFDLKIEGAKAEDCLDQFLNREKGEILIPVEILDIEEKVDSFWYADDVDQRGRWFNRAKFDPARGFQSFTGKLYNKHENGNGKEIFYYHKGVQIFSALLNYRGEVQNVKFMPSFVDVHVKNLQDVDGEDVLTLPRVDPSKYSLAMVLLELHERIPRTAFLIREKSSSILENLTSFIVEGEQVLIRVEIFDCEERRISGFWPGVVLHNEQICSFFFEIGVTFDGKFTGKRFTRYPRGNFREVEFLHDGCIVEEMLYLPNGQKKGKFD